jgi:hypothetical protein
LRVIGFSRFGGDGAPRRLGGELFRRLLRPALPHAQFPAAHPHHGTEQLLVIRSAVIHVVIGHAEPAVGGEFL